MKSKYLAVIILMASAITLFPGCYTMVWTPDQNLPDSTQTVYNFYPGVFYGSYGTYYNSPWWTNSLPSYQTSSPAYNRDTNQTDSFIRNHEAGRGSSIRNAILNVLAPATVRGGSTATTTSTNSNNSTSTGATRVENSNSGTQSTTPNRDSSPEKKNSVRNNDGSRNSNGRK